MLTLLFRLTPVIVAGTLALAGAGGSAETLASTRETFTLSMHFAASKSATTEAFGPIAEERWAPDFHPAFVTSTRAAAGAVFRTADAEVWLLHDFDPAAGLVQYVVTDAHSDIATLTIRVTGTRPSGVRMTYDIVALNAAGVTHARRLSSHASQLARHMQEAVAAYLATQPHSTRR
jgi:hypothetical protein